MRVMHQLPGRSTLPRWFRTTIAFGLTAVATVWMISLLPFLLLAALLLSLILIPVLRRLRQDMDAAGRRGPTLSSFRALRAEVMATTIPV